MSIDATRWVWKLSNKIISPIEKLILLAIADRCGERGECWPSIARLEEDTGLDRSTLIRHRKRFIELGLLTFTGKFAGRSNQIPIMKMMVDEWREGDYMEDDDQWQAATRGTDPRVPVAQSDGYPSQPATRNLKEEPKRGKDIYISDDSKNLAKPKKLNLDELNNLNPHKIPKEMISDWIENRKAKKAPITQTVWNRINTELGLCSNPIEAFEEMVCRGWVTLKAEWIKSSKHLAPTQTFYDTTSTSWIEGIEQDLL